MTVTVRLPVPLEKALADYSAMKGVTKTYIVQEALVEYLVRPERQAQPRSEPESSTFAAFKRAGLVGSFRGDAVSATKEVVRQRILGSPAKKKQR
ncbi:hypothetical protein [Ramlibacter sp.]|uniref:hypothetical protein n=1 Tax=Ramlibacter sp. TaxID=1917967 RepID=UPI003D0C4182